MKVFFKKLLAAALTRVANRLVNILLDYLKSSELEELIRGSANKLIDRDDSEINTGEASEINHQINIAKQKAGRK